MLKLTVSASLLNTIATSMATVALNIRETEATHKGLKAQTEKTIAANAELFGVPVEQYRADKATQKLKEAEAFAAKLPFFSFFKEKVTKVATLTKTDDTIEITVNGDYLTECVQAAERVTLKLLKPLADIACIFGDEEDASKAFEAKWFPKEDEDLNKACLKENEINISSKEVSAHEVPTDIRSAVDYNGWKLIPSEFSNPSPFFIDETQENFFLIHYLTAIKVEDNTEVAVTQCTLKGILSSTADLLKTAKDAKLPKSLVNAVRAYYGYEALVEVEPKTEI